MQFLLILLALLFANEVIFFNEDRILVLSFTIVMFALYKLAGDIISFELSATGNAVFEEVSFNAFLRRRLGHLLTEVNSWFNFFYSNLIHSLVGTRLALLITSIIFQGATMRFLLRNIT